MDRESATVREDLQRRLQETIAVTKANRDPQSPTQFDAALRRTVAVERRALHELRSRGEIQDDVFQRLEEELDWLELAASPSRELEVLNA